LILSKGDIASIKNFCKFLEVPVNSFSAGFKEKGEYSFFGCPGGRLDALVDVDGNLFKCLYNRNNKRVLGNVFREPFKKIWNKNNENILKRESPECRNCEYRSRCGGFCDVKMD